MKLLSVNRDEEFSPVKNASGADSPLSAKEKILSIHKKWLLEKEINENYELDFKLIYDEHDLKSLSKEEILKTGKKY